MKHSVALSSEMQVLVLLLVHAQLSFIINIMVITVIFRHRLHQLHV